MPKVYKEIIQKEKKFTSKQAFIANENLRREYENRSYVSEQKRRQDQLEKDGIIMDEYGDEFELAQNMNT